MAVAALAESGVNKITESGPMRVSARVVVVEFAVSVTVPVQFNFPRMARLRA